MSIHAVHAQFSGECAQGLTKQGLSADIQSCVTTTNKESNGQAPGFQMTHQT